MDPVIAIQARRAVTWLWDEMPTGTDPDLLATSLGLHMSTLLYITGRLPHSEDELFRRVRSRAQCIYRDEIRQIHHTLGDELFLRYLLELMLVNALGAPGGLRQRVKKNHRLLATSATCLPATLTLN